MQPFWGITKRVSLLVLLLLAAAAAAAAASPRDPERGGRRLLQSHGNGVDINSSRAGLWGKNNAATLVEHINNEVQCLALRPQALLSAPAYSSFGIQRAHASQLLSRIHWNVPKHSCQYPFHPWKSSVMQDLNCTLLSEQSIMIVGDSISEEFYFTLLSSMWAIDDTGNCNPSPARTMKCKKRNGQVGEFSVSFIRNDYLNLSTESFEGIDEQNVAFHSLPWVTRLKSERTSILMLNTGGHVQSNEKLLSGIEATLAFVRKNFPHILIFFRNTPPGHYKLTDSSFNGVPLKEPPLYDADDPFKYATIVTQNTLVAKLLAEKFPEVVRLDVHTPTVLRADSHTDPLHYCIPGPIDNWVRLFYNAIVLMGQALSSSGALTSSWTRLVHSPFASSLSSNTHTTNLQIKSTNKSNISSFSSSSSLVGGLLNTEKLTDSESLEGFDDDPILDVWRGRFGLLGDARCGKRSSWEADSLNHRNNVKHAEHIHESPHFVSFKDMASVPPSLYSPARLLISMPSRQGMVDRLSGYLTGFYAALLSNRSYFNIDRQLHALFEPSAIRFEPPKKLIEFAEVKKEQHYFVQPDKTINVSSSSDGEFTVAIVQNGNPLFTDSFELPQFYPRLFGNGSVVAFYSNRGGIYHLIKDSAYGSPLRDGMKLNPAYGVYCAFYYIFKPKKELLEFARPFSSQLANKNDLKIGIQIRTGTLALLQQNVDENNFAKGIPENFQPFFDCAEMIEKAFNVNGSRRVIWYLISDSIGLRKAAKSIYKDKLVTNTVNDPGHSGQSNDDQKHTFLKVTFSDMLLLSLCDYFVLTYNSGFAKFSAWISENRQDNAYVAFLNNNRCQKYRDPEMAQANQGI